MRQGDQMNFRKAGVLTSRDSWFVPYADKLVRILKKKGLHARLFFDQRRVPEGLDVVFMLSYFKIVDKKFLSRHKHNIIVHESGLPRGKGWSPLFWQISEGKNKVPITLFEASEKIDAGPVYLKDNLVYEGHELHDDIRKRQAEKTIELCLKFIDSYGSIKPKIQTGLSTFYRRRTSADSELDLDKTLREQFCLLRMANNRDYPAFFRHKGRKYILKIYDERDGKLLKCKQK